MIPGLKRFRRIFLTAALIALSACENFALGGGEAAVTDEAVSPARQALASSGSVDDANRALDAKNYERAYEILRQHLILNPSDDAAKLALARTYLGRSEGRNAQTVLNSMSEEAQELPQAIMLRGLALLVTGEIDAAEVQLAAALEQDPTLWRAANGLGLINDVKRNWAQAEASYQRALEIKSDAATVHNNQGYSYLLQGRIDEAIDSLTASLNYDSGRDITRANLRLALAAQGRYTAAAAGSDRTSLPQVLNNIGFVAMQIGDYESAEVFFNRAINESPVFYDTAVENLQRLKVIVGESERESPLRGVGN